MDWMDGAGIQEPPVEPGAIGMFIWNKTTSGVRPGRGKMGNDPLIPDSAWEVTMTATLPSFRWICGGRPGGSSRPSRRASPLTGRKQTPEREGPTVLFSGTLFCEHCLEPGPSTRPKSP